MNLPSTIISTNINDYFAHLEAYLSYDLLTNHEEIIDNDLKVLSLTSGLATLIELSLQKSKIRIAHEVLFNFAYWISIVLLDHTEPLLTLIEVALFALIAKVVETGIQQIGLPETPIKMAHFESLLITLFIEPVNLFVAPA